MTLVGRTKKVVNTPAMIKKHSKHFGRERMRYETIDPDLYYQ